MDKWHVPVEKAENLLGGMLQGTRSGSGHNSVRYETIALEDLWLSIRSLPYPVIGLRQLQI